MSVPDFQVTVSSRARVCMYQTARSSGPSRPILKFLAASIRSSMSNGGVRKLSAIAAFLKNSVTSGFACRPAPVRTLPSCSWIQRPSGLSRNRNWAMRLRSFRRAAYSG